MCTEGDDNWYMKNDGNYLEEELLDKGGVILTFYKEVKEINVTK